MRHVKLARIFDVKYGDAFTKVQDYPKGSTPVVKSQGAGNGVIGFFDISPNYSEVISVARTGSVGASFFHDYPCFITDDCMVVIPKQRLSHKQMFIYATYIERNSGKYNYSRKITPARLKGTAIPQPDSLRNLCESLSIPKEPSKESVLQEQISPKSLAWKGFQVNELFNLKKGKRLTKAHMTRGQVPFIGAISSNNGQRECIGQKPRHEGVTITVNYNGSVGEAFYQDTPFWASDDVNVLYPRFAMNRYTALFLATVIKANRYRFNYGRKWHLNRMKATILKLPVNPQGNPDWAFMENYVKSLPYSSNL